jgi:glycosyltransferase involved in cell wall biosynthesis
MADSSNLAPAGSPSRAVLVLNEAFYRSEGRFYTPFNWWRFALRLADHFPDFTLHVPLADAPPPPEAKPAALDRLKVEGRFFYRRIEEYYARILANRRQMLADARRVFADADVVLFRVPGPDVLPLARVAWRLGKPTVLLVCGDVIGGNAYVDACGLKPLMARMVARRLRRAEEKVARRSACVAVLGHELLSVFSRFNDRAALMASPSISRDDIYRRADVLGRGGVRLLRIARLLPNKGLEYLIQAMAVLRDRGRDIHLDIVGGGDEPAYERSLHDLARRLAVSDRITFCGHVEFGEALFNYYRQADIHVVSSLSEAMGRCILEARVFGLPTVATRVGGIPSVVHDGADGLLVEAKSGEAIAVAVERLMEDGDLRRRIIQQGYRLAEYETAEFQARRLATLITRALSGQPLGRAATDLHMIEA